MMATRMAPGAPPATPPKPCPYCGRASGNCGSGCTNPQSDLIRTAMDLPPSIARQLVRSDAWFREECELAGYEGLVAAARTFDPLRETTFRRWAHFRILGAEVDCLRNLSWIPKRAWRKLGPEARAEILLSLDSPMAERFLTSSDSPHTSLAEAEASEALRVAVVSLPANEAAVVLGVYFLGRSLESAGRDVGIDKSWACRLRNRALKRLRRSLPKEIAS